jgi:HAE1 family hydrophobic/amphiphilic exporter-1
MVSGVVLGLFIIPVLFVIFQGLQERITGKPKPITKDDGHHLNGRAVHELEPALNA